MTSSVIGSTSNQVRTTRVVSKCQKRMIRLLRHDSSVPREEDGAVEFSIVARMFRSELASSSNWSIRTWLNYLQRGGGLEKRFRYCVDPSHADTILYLRAIQGHSGGKHINPALQDNVLFPSDFAEHISHVTHSITQYGLIPGGKDVKKGYRAARNKFERFREVLELISRFEFDFRRSGNY